MQKRNTTRYCYFYYTAYVHNYTYIHMIMIIRCWHPRLYCY